MKNRIAMLTMICSTIPPAFAQIPWWQPGTPIACEWTDDPEAGPPPKVLPGNKLVCSCSLTQRGKKDPSCHEEACAPETDVDAILAMRCLQIRAPIDGESTAWLVKKSNKEQCSFKLERENSTPKSNHTTTACFESGAFVANVHSHYFGLSPKPSPPDIAAAKRCNKPFYVVSINQVWRANPDGSVEQITIPIWEELNRELACGPGK